MSHPLAIVMAAGKGTRMESDLPKVLVPACGRPLVEYVLDALADAQVRDAIVVVGYRADDVRNALSDREQLRFADFVSTSEENWLRLWRGADAVLDTTI